MASTSTTNSVPDYMERFYQDNMNNLAANYDIARNIYNANSAYTPYTNPRIQDFTADQLRGMQMVRDNVSVGQDALAGAAARAGQAAKSYSDNVPLDANAVQSYYQGYLGRNASADEIQGWLGSARSVNDLRAGIGGSAEAAARAAAGYTPDLSKIQDGSFRPNSVQTENFNQSLGYNRLDPAMAQAHLIGDRAPKIDALAQIAGGNYTADQVTADQISKMQQLATKDFGGEDAQRYMNPYTSQVTQNTLREMGRVNDAGQRADAARAAKAKAFGGSRQAIVQAERDRNFGYQVGDTTAKSYDAAYQNAQNQFNTDVNRQLQTGQFNVGTELTRQQQNQAANLQGQQANQAANAQAAQFGLNQNLAAQTANVQNEFARRQANQNVGLQSLLADQSSQDQIGLANQAATNNMALANEEARQNVFKTNAANFYQNQANQFTTQVQNQNMGLQAYNANRDQYNSDLSRQLQSGQLALSLAPQAQQMGMQDANNVMTIGGMQQQMGQQGLSMGYQDFLNQKSQPYENFAFLQNALQGTNYNPYQGLMSTNTTASDPSKLGQLAGVATTAIGVIGGTGGFGSNGWLKSAWS